MEAQKCSPKQGGDVEKPWHELIPSFSGTSAGVCEALGNIQPEYGFKHGYQSDTDSNKIETASNVTQFDLLHEDDLEEMCSMQTSDHQASKENINGREKGTLPCLSSFSQDL